MSTRGNILHNPEMSTEWVVLGSHHIHLMPFTPGHTNGPNAVVRQVPYFSYVDEAGRYSPQAFSSSSHRFKLKHTGGEILNVEHEKFKMIT